MWKSGHKVQFYIGPNKYCGVILDYDPYGGVAYVEFIAGYKDGAKVVSREIFLEDQLRKCITRTNTFLFTSEVAYFITEKDGIRPGIVLDQGEDEVDEWFDFGYYRIKADGSIDYCVEKKVARERLVYICDDADDMKILPVKRNTKVEFVNPIVGRGKGKVTDIYGSFDFPLFEISYRYCTENGEKETATIDEVTSDQIRILKYL